MSRLLQSPAAPNIAQNDVNYRGAHSFFAVIGDGAKLGYPMIGMWSTGVALEEMW